MIRITLTNVFLMTAIGVVLSLFYVELKITWLYGPCIETVFPEHTIFQLLSTTAYLWIGLSMIDYLHIKLEVSK